MSSTAPTRDHFLALDQTDSLAGFRDRFSLPQGVIYLDGNSLGALPKATGPRLQEVVTEEWGQELIRAWNSRGWMDAPVRVGDKLARLLGAAPGEIVVADSTSLNIFKLLAALMQRPARGERKVILSERGNFPTDLYMAQGLSALRDHAYDLRLVDGDPAEAFDESVAVAILTQVDYRSGRKLDMAAVQARADTLGIAIIWDLSHSAGAIPVALNADGARFAVGCGYKYLNGGPGAPAFVYVRKDEQAATQQPLTGWFGHGRPFEFITQYEPAANIRQMQVGTPSALAITALEIGVDLMLEAPPATLRQKSIALTSNFIGLVESRCAGLGLELVSPRDATLRGSQVSFRHAQAYPVMQALIERGVIGDFRRPDCLRFGFTPLYVRHMDVWDAVSVLEEVLRTESWKAERFQRVNAVT
jgi:kynureninase